MIVEAKFNYSADVRFPRKPKDDTVNAAATTFVEVPELSAEQAPIAFWWCGRGAFKDGAVAFRSHEGILYEPVHLSAEYQGPGTLPADVAFRPRRSRMAAAKQPKFAGTEYLHEMGKHTGGGFVSEGMKLHDSGNRPIELMGIKSITSDDRAERETQLRENYAKLLVVDGVLHTRTECPLIWVRNERWCEIGTSDADRYVPVLIPPAQMFRIDEFDRARSLFAKAVKGTYKKPSEYDWLRPEIVDASLITFDMTRYMVEQTAELVLHRMSTKDRTYSDAMPHVATVAREIMFAFVELRDQVARKASNDVLIDAMLKIADCLGRGGYYREEARAVDDLVERLTKEGVYQAPSMEITP